MPLIIIPKWNRDIQEGHSEPISTEYRQLSLVYILFC